MKAVLSAMPILQSGINLNIDDLPFGHLISILVSVLAAVAFIFTVGFSVRFGDKEINIGGIRRLLAKKDEDTLLKESLKQFADDVDHETEADLYDLVADTNSRIEQVALSEHCFFTFEKFISIVKSELYRRVRRNNLRERLSGERKTKYVSKMLGDIESRYESFQVKIAGTKCGDSYAKFSIISGALHKELSAFFDDAVAVMVAGYKKKIKKYLETRELFKTAPARKSCCDNCIAKNRSYVKNLTGEEIPV